MPTQRWLDSCFKSPSAKSMYLSLVQLYRYCFFTEELRLKLHNFYSLLALVIWTRTSVQGAEGLCRIAVPMDQSHLSSWANKSMRLE